MTLRMEQRRGWKEVSGLKRGRAMGIHGRRGNNAGKTALGGTMNPKREKGQDAWEMG